MNEKQRFILKVWPKITKFLDKHGAWKFPGYLGPGRGGWPGPYVWGEDGDLKMIITRYCEKEFGSYSLHNESKIDKFRFLEFNSKTECRESVDIDVTNATSCKNEHEFRKLQHSLFIEVKQIPKGCIFNDARKKIQGFEEDCRKLQLQVKKKRCKFAIAIVVDDGDVKGNSYIKAQEGDIESFVRSLRKKFNRVEPLVYSRGNSYR